MRRAALALIMLAGCIPIRETWRPQLRGELRDADGAPLANAVVRACTVSRWQGFSHGCAIDGTTWTDADGGFGFDEVRRWGWLTVGEAPLPTTVVYVCGDGGARQVPLESGYAPTLDPSEYLARACR